MLSPPAGGAVATPTRAAAPQGRPCATLVPDGEFLELNLCDCTNQYFMSNRCTGEVVQLEHGPPEYSYEMTVEEGSAFLTVYGPKGEVSVVEAGSLLEYSLYKRDGCGELLLCKKSSSLPLSVVPLKTHQKSFRQSSLGIYLGAAASTSTKFIAASLVSSRQQVHIFFSLLSIWEALNLKFRDNETAGAWVMNSMTSWERFQKVAVGFEGHIIRSSPYKAQEGDVGDRILPFPACSSLGLVALLLKWGWGRHKLRRPEGIAKVHEMLRAMIKGIASSWRIDLVLDSRVDFGDGLRPLRGRNGVSLQVDDSGAILLAPLLHMTFVEDGVGSSWAANLVELVTDRMLVFDFLGIVAQHFQTDQQKRMLVFRQVVRVTWGLLVRSPSRHRHSMGGVVVSVAPTLFRDKIASIVWLVGGRFIATWPRSPTIHPPCGICLSPSPTRSPTRPPHSGCAFLRHGIGQALGSLGEGRGHQERYLGLGERRYLVRLAGGQHVAAVPEECEGRYRGLQVLLHRRSSCLSALVPKGSESRCIAAVVWEQDTHGAAM